MLRHEASATDETDSSFIRMTEVKKDCNKSEAERAEKHIKLLYIFRLRSMTINIREDTNHGSKTCKK